MAAIFLYLFLFFFLSVPAVSAQVVINEVSPSSDPEWVELYNLGVEEISLNGCTLYLDDNHDIQKITFSDADRIRGYKVVEKGTYDWNNNWLNNSGDEISISCGSIDTLSYGSQTGSFVDKPGDGMTLGRFPDGTDGFQVLSDPTKGLSNNPPPTLTPSPLPTFTQTPKPTKSPAPSPSPKAAKSYSPTPSSKPSLQINKNPEPSAIQVSVTEIEQSESILGIQEPVNNSPTPSPVVSGQTSSKFPAVAITFIVLGVGLTGFAFFPIFKKKWLGYNLSGGNHNDRNQDEADD